MDNWEAIWMFFGPSVTPLAKCLLGNFHKPWLHIQWVPSLGKAQWLLYFFNIINFPLNCRTALCFTVSEAEEFWLNDTNIANYWVLSRKVHFYQIWSHLRSPPLSTSPPLLCIPASKSPKYPPLTPGWSLYNSLTLPNPTILLFICCKCQGPLSTPKHNVKIQFLMHNPYSW